MGFREEYSWNGPNFFLKLKQLVKPTLKHDGGYQLIEDGLLPFSARKVLDKELKQDVAYCGTWVRFLAQPIYLSVRAFGGLSIRFNMYMNQRSLKILVAT